MAAAVAALALASALAFASAGKGEGEGGSSRRRKEERGDGRRATTQTDMFDKWESECRQGDGERKKGVIVAWIIFELDGSAGGGKGEGGRCAGLFIVVESRWARGLPEEEEEEEKEGEKEMEKEKEEKSKHPRNVLVNGILIRKLRTLQPLPGSPRPPPPPI